MPTISSSFLGTFPVVQIDSCFAILVPTNACDNNDIFLVSKYLANVFFNIQDDYYDSDEDEFFDRTGDLVTKREQRKARLEHKGQTVETYESLKEKLAITENAIREINESLEKSKAVGTIYLLFLKQISFF